MSTSVIAVAPLIEVLSPPVTTSPGENPAFADFMWADNIPKLVQARLIDSFENYDIARAPLRAVDVGQNDFQLLIDIRRLNASSGLMKAAIEA